MNIKGIAHVAIIVRDLGASRRVWEDCLGLPLAGTEDFPRTRAALAIYGVGNAAIELIAGTHADSRYARLVAEGRGGLHHVCFEVEDIDAAVRDLKEKGVALLDEAPRTGHAGSRIVFLDPSGTDNCLVELAEFPRQVPPADNGAAR